MKSMCAFCVGVLATATSLPVLAQTHILKIATGELPPYMTAARADQGISVSVVRGAWCVVRGAFELAGYQVKYTFLPWSRARAETRLGKRDNDATPP